MMLNAARRRSPPSCLRTRLWPPSPWKNGSSEFRPLERWGIFPAPPGRSRKPWQTVWSPRYRAASGHLSAGGHGANAYPPEANREVSRWSTREGVAHQESVRRAVEGRAVGGREVARVGRPHDHYAAVRFHRQGEARIRAGASDLDRTDQIERAVQLGQLSGEVPRIGVQGLACDVDVAGGVQAQDRDGEVGVGKVVLVEEHGKRRVQTDDGGGAGEHDAEINPGGVHRNGIGDDVARGAGNELEVN